MSKRLKNVYLSLICITLMCVLISIVYLRSQLVIEDEPIAEVYTTNLVPSEMEIVKTEPAPKPEYEITIIEDEVIALSKMVWGEARGCGKTQQSATVWCVLNRADDWNMSIIEVLSAPHQFSGYKTNNPVTDEIRTLVIDVLTRWQVEKQGAPDSYVMRTLPKEYKWFTGDGHVNTFRDEWLTGNVWEFTDPTPYDN